MQPQYSQWVVIGTGFQLTPNTKSIGGNFAEILSSPNSVGIARVFSDLLGYAFAHPVYWGIYLRAIQSLYLWEIHSIVA